ncbi:hypothetical protein MTO96_008459 [Rhipicephalus appendiculatus]
MLKLQNLIDVLQVTNDMASEDGGYAYGTPCATSSGIDSGVNENSSVTTPVLVPNTPAVASTEESSPLTYRLFATVLHLGARSTSSGHYIALAEDSRCGGWWCFDDNVVNAVTDIDAELRKPSVLQNTYMLFYKRC